MNVRFAAVASVATAILLLSACGGDDSSTTTVGSPPSTSATAGATTIAKGEDVEFVGNDGLAGQTLNITAEEVNGKVTGEFRVNDVVVGVDCANTDTDGVVILGGAVTADPGANVGVGELLALIIREGDPDSVALYGNDSGAASCTEMLKSIPDNNGDFVDVEDGSDIETS
jgi:hypothetical protein